MDLLQLTSLLIVLAALFGSVNYLVLKLPTAIGILVVSLLASLVILGLDLVVTGFTIDDQVRSPVGGIAFSDALLEGMLGLLLFAGALHVKLEDLRAQWVLVALMATMDPGDEVIVFDPAYDAKAYCEHLEQVISLLDAGFLHNVCWHIRVVA